MATVHTAYHGDVMVFSDDGGKTYGSSGTSLHLAGLDEISAAQTLNGSLAAIIRNFESVCQERPAAKCMIMILSTLLEMHRHQ